MKNTHIVIKKDNAVIFAIISICLISTIIAIFFL